MADNLQNLPLTLSLANTGLIAGTTNTLTSTVASVCSIGGKFAAALAVLTNSATTPTSDATSGALFSAVPLTSSAVAGVGAALVFGVNAAGAIKCALGPPVALDGLGVTTTPANFIAAPQFPALPDDFCPIAYTLVRTTPSVPSFTVGTSSWVNNCTTFTKVCTLPARPQIL
jgi:hypothetical protein